MGVELTFYSVNKTANKELNQSQKSADTDNIFECFQQMLKDVSRNVDPGSRGAFIRQSWLKLIFLQNTGHRSILCKAALRRINGAF